MRMRKRMKKVLGRWITALLMTAISIGEIFAQGKAGITNATNEVKGYFDVGVDLTYAIGAVVGLVGAVKVYNKWSNGEQDTAKVASSWFGACIFLVVVATILRGFFKV